MNSHQDRLGGFGTDEISLEDEDSYGGIFNRFPEPENRFPSVDREAEYPFSSSNTILSDKAIDDNHEDMFFKPNLDFLNEETILNIDLNDYEGADKVIDTIFKHSDEVWLTTLQIKCYQGQLSKENIQSILNASKAFKLVQFVDTVDSRVFETHKPVQNEMQRNLEGVTMNSVGLGVSPAKIEVTPKKDFHKHQKCRSVGGEDEFKETLSNKSK